jgi:hypothetical protein
MYKFNDNNGNNLNEKLVSNVLTKHPKLKHLKDILLSNIAMLDDDLLKEPGLDATLDLLSQYSRMELTLDKIKKTRPTEAPLLRSIRLKIELTSPLEATHEAPEFKILQSEAQNTKLYYE